MTGCLTASQTEYSLFYRALLQKRPVISCKNVGILSWLAVLALLTRYFLNRSKLHKIKGLFCKRALQKRLYSAKETYNFAVLTRKYAYFLGKILTCCLTASQAEYSLFYRALLQKSPVIWRSLLIVDSKSRQHRMDAIFSLTFENLFSNWNDHITQCCLDLLSTMSRLLKITGLFCKRAL